MMITTRIGILAGLGIASAAAVLTLAAPPASAYPSLVNAQSLCDSTGGTFAGSPYQYHGLCTYTVAGHLHHLYYTEGQLVRVD
jgi:hypothetical protein